MRRTLAALTVAAASAVALTGCVVLPSALDPFVFGSYAPAYDQYDDEFDPAQEEQWQEEAREFELDFAESVAAELRDAGSQLPPAEGEPIEAFRHVVIGAGYAWCDRLYIDEDRQGDAGEHAAQAERYGWSAEEYRIIAEAAEPELCGY